MASVLCILNMNTQHRHLRRRHRRLLLASTRVGVTHLLSTDRRRHLRRRHRRLLPASTRVGVTQLAVGHPSGRQLVLLTHLVFATLEWVSTLEWVASSVQQTFPGVGRSYQLPLLQTLPEVGRSYLLPLLHVQTRLHH